MKRRIFLSMILFLCAVLIGCFSSGPETADSGGSGSEIVGEARYAEDDSASGQPKARYHASSYGGAGLPVVGGSIFVFKENFQAVPSASYIPDATTDANGYFSIGSVSPGKYILEANDGKGKAVAARFTVSGDGKQVDVGTLVALEEAKLRYTINTGLSAGDEISYRIYMLGTRISAQGDGNNLTMDLGSIPTGISYSVKAELLKPIAVSKTFTNISFSPGAVLERTFDLQ